LFTRKIEHEAAAEQIERKWVDREIRQIREREHCFYFRVFGVFRG